MPHIIDADDLAAQINRGTSLYATAEANIAANVYTPEQLAKAQTAMADFLTKDDELCDKLKINRDHLRDKCGLAEPE